VPCKWWCLSTARAAFLCFSCEICEIVVSNRPPRSNWSTLGIQPSLVFLFGCFYTFLFWYCYSATQPFGTIATRGYGVVATVIAPLRAPRRSPAHCRMQKGASKHPISSRRPRFWSYQAAERRSLRKDLLKPQQHCVKLG
jgi:hypothetical protein